ncbi:hypothetical protein Goklo_023187 [Gossypium klotzschianum]|uniref:Uncharacterized protein n=1 Tax=Gossypium klotzschianum TaxID=34286 RepID=A0A7J8TQ29_9ROSI|nr:hypothetical protein [Gossypium klotzschianum]
MFITGVGLDCFLFLLHHSEITTEGRRITKLDQILLNGNNIAIVSLNDFWSQEAHLIQNEAVSSFGF